jgi:site-specific DNA-methyltransferase (adenine-specific)
MSYGDTGTAARFFPNFEPSPLDDVTPFLYTAKASRREREAGLEGMEERERTKANMTSRAERENRGKRQDAKARNHHPTVKPLSLMRWLAKLITPPGGVVLDPFLGSGTTGMAAVMEGFGFIGVEQDAEYIEIARRRIAWAQEQQPPLLRATGD